MSAARILSRFPMAAGTEGRLTFELTGSAVPVSFTNASNAILDPEGNEVPDEDIEYGPQKIQRNRSVFRIKSFLARQTGDYTLVLGNNARVSTQAGGKFKVRRKRKVKFEGDENSPPFLLSLQRGDRYVIKVKTTAGDPTLIFRVEQPDGFGGAPAQTRKKPAGILS